MSEPCCDYRDHSPGPCACPEHKASALHPVGKRHWPSERMDALRRLVGDGLTEAEAAHVVYGGEDR